MKRADIMRMRRKVEARTPGMIVIAGPFFIFDESGAEAETRACAAVKAQQQRAGVLVQVVSYAQAAWVLRSAKGLRGGRGAVQEQVRTVVPLFVPNLKRGGSCA